MSHSGTPKDEITEDSTPGRRTNEPRISVFSEYVNNIHPDKWDMPREALIRQGLWEHLWLFGRLSFLQIGNRASDYYNCLRSTRLHVNVKVETLLLFTWWRWTCDLRGRPSPRMVMESNTQPTTWQSLSMLIRIITAGTHYLIWFEFSMNGILKAFNETPIFFFKPDLLFFTLFESLSQKI